MKKPPMLASAALAAHASNYTKAALIDLVADLLVRLHGEDQCAADRDVIKAFIEAMGPIVRLRLDRNRSAAKASVKGGGR